MPAIDSVHTNVLSIIKGQSIIEDMRAALHSEQAGAQPYLDLIRQLPFVRDVRLEESSAPEIDFYVELTTSAGKTRFQVELKRAYLDRAVVRGLIARAQILVANRGAPLLLLARYVSPAIADMLVASGVNFVDQAGNMNLMLGDRFHRTVIGKRQAAKEAPVSSERLTPAKIQLLITGATYPESAGWPVRKLGEVAGVSKSLAARKDEILRRAGLVATSGRFDVVEPSKLRDQLVFGYAQLLRPRILIGRYRSQYPPNRLLDNIVKESGRAGVRYSLTGGPAADLLQRYYRGPELPVHVSDVSDGWLRRLKLLPDRAGSVILLRSFGEVVFWREVEGFWVAPPWLIYAELMSSEDPRAHEAGERIRQELLVRK